MVVSSGMAVMCATLGSLLWQSAAHLARWALNCEGLNTRPDGLLIVHSTHVQNFSMVCTQSKNSNLGKVQLVIERHSQRIHISLL